MGGGGRSSSATTTNTTNTSGTSAISGDNLGVVLSGVNDSDIEIDMRLTDHGAIEAAEKIAGQAIDGNNKAIEESFDFGSKVVGTHEEITKSALDNMRKNNEDTVAAVKQMAAQSGENARAALLMAENTASRSQTGNSGDMTKVVIAVAAAFGVSIIALAIGGKS